MQKYTFLEHTADVRMHVEASSIEELFSGALMGMSRLLYSKEMPKEITITKQTSLTAEDETSLLIDFLSEALTLTHIHKAFFTHVTFTTLTPTHINATLSGYRNVHFEKDVKAVTYHEAKISRQKGRLETVIIFDI